MITSLLISLNLLVAIIAVLLAFQVYQARVGLTVSRAPVASAEAPAAPAASRGVYRRRHDVVYVDTRNTARQQMLLEQGYLLVHHNPKSYKDTFVYFNLNT